jgi:hypothetical protein
MAKGDGRGGPRANSGRKPGTSLLLKGLTKSGRDLATPHAERAIAVLAEIMNDEKAPPQARINAAVHMLDRAFGKPVDVVKINMLLDETDQKTEDMVNASVDTARSVIAQLDSIAAGLACYDKTPGVLVIDSEDYTTTT